MTLKDKNLITLKEAAQLSGYSPDYIGQLIRAGKIPGKQVFINVAWMTTAEAVMEYKNKGKNKAQEQSINEKILNYKRRIGIEMNIIKLFFQNFKSALPVFIIVIISFLLLCVFILYNLLNPKIIPARTIQADNQTLSF